MKSYLKELSKKCVKTDILKKEVPILVYERQANRETTAMQFLYQSDGSPLFDHLVSIERTGPSRDGTYRSMKNKTLKEDLVAPVEDLFLQADKDDRISTTAIGDGGNELGMGKVKDQVEKYVKHGKEIACIVSCDYLITAGVSNWGGYALAVGLHVLSTCPIHARYVRRGLAKIDEDKGVEEFLNSIEQEGDILQMLADEGVRDGVTGQPEQSVDGFKFYSHHAEQIQKCQAVINS